MNAGEMSLQDRRSQLSLQHYNRLHRLPDSPAFKAGCAPNIQRQHYNNNRTSFIPFHIRIERLKEKLVLPELNIIPHSTHNEPPWKHSSVTCSSICNLKKTTISTLSLRIHFLDYIYSEHSDSIHIHTDESKTNNDDGYSIVIHHTTIKKHIRSEATIFKAELCAIHDAIEHIYNDRNKSFTIYSQFMMLSNTYTMIGTNHLQFSRTRPAPSRQLI